MDIDDDKGNFYCKVCGKSFGFFSSFVTHEYSCPQRYNLAAHVTAKDKLKYLSDLKKEWEKYKEVKNAK
jgi:uncharacterized lipoprotein YbaY